MKLGMFMHPIHDYRRGYHTLPNEDMDVIRCGPTSAGATRPLDRTGGGGRRAEGGYRR